MELRVQSTEESTLQTSVPVTNEGTPWPLLFLKIQVLPSLLIFLFLKIQVIPFPPHLRKIFLRWVLHLIHGRICARKFRRFTKPCK